MKKILTGALAALTIGGALAASTVPASAETHGGYRGGGYQGGGWRGGGRDHDGWRGGYGGDVGAGLLGLAVGAALTDGYGPGYYAPGYYYPPAPRCRVEMRWNPAWGGYNRVRVCY